MAIFEWKLIPLAIVWRGDRFHHKRLLADVAATAWNESLLPGVFGLCQKRTCALA